MIIVGGKWTAEGVAALRKLAAQGNLSASQIAAALGVTRNAVIGKCSREKIPLPLSGGGW